jgi:hypothetical protein
MWKIVSKQEWDDLNERVRDIEKHFVTARDPKTGAVTETLADVPVSRRKKDPTKGNHLRGLSMQQRLKVMEATDGGRKI